MYEKYGNKLPKNSDVAKRYKTLVGREHIFKKLGKTREQFFEITEVTKQNIFKTIPKREKSKWDKIVDKLKETKYSIINNKKYINRTNDAQEAINEMVNIQNLRGYSKHLATIWSGEENISMNQYLQGEEIELRGVFSSVNEVKKYTDDLIELIDNMPKEKCIPENTLLVRGVSTDRIDLNNFIPGSKPRKLGTLTSSSYNIDTADDFSGYTDIDGPQGYIIKIHAPQGTKGVAINIDVTTASEEYEYLLSPNQKYITHSVEDNIIEIELIE
ncbi:MAG: hypothetical protein IJH65_10145 [Methanobrevibacter sp.]|nr:hypothetical protein [Methanobrevibacter sp.]